MLKNHAHLQERWQSEVDNLMPTASSEQESVPAHVEAKAWANVLDLQFLQTLADREPHAVFVDSFPIELARQHGVLALSSTDGSKDLTDVAISSIDSWPVLDVIGRFLETHARPIVVPKTELLKSINSAYQQQSNQSNAIVDELDRSRALEELTSTNAREDLLETTGRPPVVNLVNSVLFEAVRAKASDIHIQPKEDSVIVRERVDGVLFDTLTIPKEYQEEVISRLKVLGRMNIAEKRLPQDGRATVQVGDRAIDLRIASLPTSFGERVVIRFLDKSARLYTLEELGMDAETLLRFRRLIKLEHGLLLVTGPTGGGKSTTLYAALQEINAKDLNVLTLEDPIEYQLDGISQTQINTKKGLTFASGLRNVLRQDPDIIMVGEIRDEPTAVMAIQSALTGHFVFSTLHTNDAASAVTRLLDLGIEPYLVSSCLVSVVAQRLVRRICPDCREEKRYTESELSSLGLDVSLAKKTFFKGRGCQKCRNTGYRGRLGVFELLEVTDDIRDRIQQQDNASQIRDSAQQFGMKLLHTDGLTKSEAGATTLEEVVRITVNA